MKHNEGPLMLTAILAGSLILGANPALAQYKQKNLV